MDYELVNDGKTQGTIKAHWNHEGDSLTFQRFDAEGKLVECDYFGISPEEFNTRFADYRRVVD